MSTAWLNTEVRGSYKDIIRYGVSPLDERNLRKNGENFTPESYIGQGMSAKMFQLKLV